ncbi:MAG TPA: Rho termination factor N-terminal domain-containing protein [Solirubrobacterales bacterium]|nr:Rho termination factor N-terminal domain-containing protein [Solirubrobacterales bacterium]
MTKAELDSKHLAELHALAAEQGVERYRMLSRAELIEALASGESQSSAQQRPPRQRRQRSGSTQARERHKPAPAGDEPPAPRPESATAAAGEASPSRRRRRRRRPFGRRRSREVHVHELLLPPLAGRQVIVSSESREGCTTLLRETAVELSKAAKGLEPVILLIDPSPEELAEWRRDAPQAEIVAAGQAKHADDALAQAGARAKGGEDVLLLIDSLSRLSEAYGDGGTAKEFFDAGREAASGGGGSLTVVAAVEKV